MPAASSGRACSWGGHGPPGAEGSEGHREGSLTTHGSPSLQQALIAKGQLKASEGR